MTFTSRPIAFGSRDPAVLSLQRKGYDRQTGGTTVTLTLAHTPVAGTLMLFKNGLLIDDSGGYTIAKNVVTLAVAAVAADVYQAYYDYQAVD